MDGLILSYGVSLGSAILILVIGMWIAKFVKSTSTNILLKRNVDEMLARFGASAAYYIIVVFIAITALRQAGIRGLDTQFAAIVAAAGLAVGLALQGTLSNFAAGVMILLFRPFKVGDFIEGGGTMGIVEEVSIFTTFVRTGDNKQIIVPNSGLTGGNITNYSAKETRRVDMEFGIGYDDDIKKVKEILMDILVSDERVLEDPAPQVALSELGDSSVNFVCRPWVKSGDYWPLKFHVNEEVKRRFDEAGINIPYPQRDVHVYEHKAAG